MTVAHLAVADYDVLTGSSPTTSVGIATGLDGDAVVARVERATLNQDVLTGFGVTTVVVGAQSVNGHVAYNQVVAEQRMNHPERRVLQGDAFDENGIAAVEVHQLGAKGVFRCHDAPVNGSKRFRQSEQTVASAHQLGAFALFGKTAAFHVPPGIGGALSVDCSLAGQGDIGLAVCINQRMCIVAVNSFPTGNHGGEVIRLVGRKL